MLIKTGFLVAYDYEMLRNSLPCIYNSSDIICLCIDKNRQSWSGSKFEISTSFFEWLSFFDINKKIIIYEDYFYSDKISAKEMETNQRNKMAKFLGIDGWHLQLDVDEYFVNFEAFVNKLKKINSKSTTVYVKWKTIFKESDNGFFYINDYQYVPIATNDPKYKLCRLTSNKKKKYLDYIMLHQSWGRSADDTFKKLKNWGHKDDFDTNSFFQFWKSVDIFNFKYIKNFHPLNPFAWPSLEYIDGKDISSILKNLGNDKIRSERSLFLKKLIYLLTPPIINNIRIRLRKLF
jgi:hypothetical protein